MCPKHCRSSEREKVRRLGNNSEVASLPLENVFGRKKSTAKENKKQNKQIKPGIPPIIKTKVLELHI